MSGNSTTEDRYIGDTRDQVSLKMLWVDFPAGRAQVSCAVCSC